MKQMLLLRHRQSGSSSEQGKYDKIYKVTGTGKGAKPILDAFFALLKISFSIINYYPAYVLLGKDNAVNAPFWILYCTLPIGLVLCVLARLVFNKGVQSYHSTGT